LLSKARSYFKSYGTWEEPFGSYLFFGKLEVKLVHTTFFLKDYELNSYIYLFGVESLEEPERRFADFISETLEKFPPPPEHYLSSFVLLELEGKAPPLFREKSLWFGFRGKYRWGILSLRGSSISYPKEMEQLAKFISGFKS
jgi:hypothetical protein